MFSWKEYIRLEIRKRMAGLKLEPTREDEIVEELAQHLEDRYAEVRDGCATDAQALHKTLAELSSSEILARELRRVERPFPTEPLVLGTNRRKNMITDSWQDLRYGARMLRKKPGFTLIAVITLALGIGATSAVFSLIQGVLLTPPPYRQPERLVLIESIRTDGQQTTRAQGWAPAQWQEWQQEAKSFDAIAGYGWTFNFLVLDDGSESLEGMWVTKDYFSVVGLKPVLGRVFMDSDIGSKAAPAIILGYDLWQRRFDGDPNIVGKTIRISRRNTPPTVIGVMPPAVRFLPAPTTAQEPNYNLNAQVDYWLPASPDPERLKQPG